MLKTFETGAVRRARKEFDRVAEEVWVEKAMMILF
jgi:hypothetical protein